MKTKRSYFSPTAQVVEITISKALLESSPASAKMDGYTYQTGGWED